MFFKFALYISLIIFGAGMVYKLSAWFWQDIGTGEKDIPISRRISGAVKGMKGILISLKLLTLIKAFFLDVLLQARILKDQNDRILWIMHLLIFVGFIMLVLMHALGSIITISFFPDYQSTLNPFLFLRNLFGLLVLAGLVLAVVRRALFKRERIVTSVMDYYVIVILAVIVVSGFLLEATKISSHSTFQQMVEDYGDTSERKELEALEGYWVQYFGLVSPEITGALSKSSLEQGRDLHEKSCAACHSRPHWAPISYGLSRPLRVFALAMDRAGGQTVLWYIHFMACFIGLVYLPFSKFFHIFATPVSLLVASVTGPVVAESANAATRQVLERDGCSHGGRCHEECPVRQNRQQRIGLITQFHPVLDYVELKDSKDLGSRYIEK